MEKIKQRNPEIRGEKESIGGDEEERERRRK